MIDGRVDLDWVSDAADRTRILTRVLILVRFENRMVQQLVRGVGIETAICSSRLQVLLIRFS